MSTSYDSNHYMHIYIHTYSFLYYLSIAGGRVGFIPFPRVLALSEMQLSRPGFELGVTSPFPKTLTITPRALSAVQPILLLLDWWLYQFAGTILPIPGVKRKQGL